MQQAALAIHQGAQLSTHAVEVAPQVFQFVAPHALDFSEAGRQIACGGSVESIAQGANWPRKIPGKDGGEQQTGNQAEGHRQIWQRPASECAFRAARSVRAARTTRWRLAAAKCTRRCTARPMLTQPAHESQVACAVGRSEPAHHTVTCFAHQQAFGLGA